MNVQTFFKGLGMALIAVVITYFSTTPIDYVMMGVAAVSAVLVYTGKNAILFLRSDSKPFWISVINVVSGVIIAIGTAIVNSVASYIINGVVLWPVVLKLVLSVTLIYLGGTFVSPPRIAVTK